MLFSILPNIEYDVKPTRFPFSSADFTIAKNLFKRLQVNNEIFDYTLYYNKYRIRSGERLDSLAQRFYGMADYDWIIAVSNNIVNIQEDLPMDNHILQEWAEKTYGSTVYSDVRRYEIREDVKNTAGTIFFRKGQVVDETFYNGTFSYNDQDSANTEILVNGNVISKPVTIWEDEIAKNEAKAEIYILKASYVQAFITELKKQSKYKKCSAYITDKLKKTTV